MLSFNHFNFNVCDMEKSIAFYQEALGLHVLRDRTAADGSWAVGDTVGFDQGLAAGLAYCGDPLGDGYFYDPQGVEVDVVADTTTTPVTVPPTTPPAPPANAVAGTPTYAG